MHAFHKSAGIAFFSVLACSMCDAQVWEQSEGTAGLNMQCLLTDAGWVFSGGELGTFRSNDEGATFSEANAGNSSIGPTRGFTSDGNFVYQCTSNGVFRSSDNGGTWSQYSEGISQGLSHGMAFTSGRIWLATQSGVYVSEDQAETWSAAGLENINVRCLTVIGESVFAGTIDEGLFRTTDYGETWSPINYGLTSSSFRAIEAHQGVLFAGGEIGTGVFRSIDEGETWTLLTGELPLGSYRGFASDAGWIAAGSFMSGVYVSSDFGDSWVQVNEGLEDLSIFDLEFTDTHLFAATNTAGTWRFDRAALGSAAALEQLIEQAGIMVHPNPTSGQVTAGVELDETWRIYDSEGRMVLAGIGPSVDFSTMPAGLYLLRTTTKWERVIRD